MNRGLGVLLAAATLVLAGCGGGDTGGPTTTSSAQTTLPGDGATTTTAEVVEPGPALFEGLDGDIILKTPTSGGGERPLLEWEPFAGADHYAVFLYAPSGEAYWVWSGDATSVHVGGEPLLAEGSPGPNVAEGMSWAVIAYDAAMVPVAVSERRPIAP
jgi:hypothetical protein